MATGSSGLCVPVLQMMNNGSAEFISLTSVREGIVNLIRVPVFDDDPLEH
jgi:hypothetical protein